MKRKEDRFIFWWLFPLVILTGAVIRYVVWPTPATIHSPETISTKNKNRSAGKNTNTEVAQHTDTHKITTKENTTNDNNKTVRNKTTTLVDVAKTQTSIGITAANTTNNRRSLQVTDESIDNIKEAKQKQAATQTVMAIVPPTETVATANPTSVNSLRPTTDSGNKQSTDRIIEKTDTLTQPSMTDTVNTSNDLIKKAKERQVQLCIAGWYGCKYCKIYLYQ